MKKLLKKHISLIIIIAVIYISIPIFVCAVDNTNSTNNTEEESHVVKFDFTLNEVEFTDIGNGDVLHVDDNFNLSSISELYITNINIDGTDVYSYNDNEYSYNLLDSQNNHILEANISKTSNNYAKLRIESHPNDIKEEDKVSGHTYYGFYIPEITIVKDGFRGVEVTTSVMPDSYDFTTWNGVDLSATNEEEPGEVTVYYGEDTINFESKVNSDIKSISLMEDSDIPDGVVEIDNDTFEITVNSNYYNEIPLKIELEDNTVGYVIVKRIGIFIGEVKSGDSVFYHGASRDVGNNLNKYTDMDRIVCVFYHEGNKTYNNYDLIANITYEDGSSETVVAEGVGDVSNASGNIVGSDYILWKGNSGSPVKISVTAVNADSLDDEENFGGATFGSKEGVVWERQPEGDN